LSHRSPSRLPASLLLFTLACGDDGSKGPSGTAADDAGTAADDAGTAADDAGTAADDAGTAADGGPGPGDDAPATSAPDDTSDAGPADGTGSDSSSSADGSTGTPTDPPCGGLWCDDFESGAIDRTAWTFQEISRGNSIEVQSDVVAHGEYAVRFHAQGGTSFAMMFHEALPEELGQHYFGRMYFRITDFPWENGGHTAYITSSADLRGFPWSDHHFEVGSYFGGRDPIWQLTYWTGDGPEYIGAGGQIPHDQWFCLQWEFNDEPDQIFVWVDGSDELGAAFDDIEGESDLLGEMNTLGVGFRTFHPDGAPDIDVYVDDIVLDTEPVDCLP
jgi:hypothetical protein